MIFPPLRKRDRVNRTQHAAGLLRSADQEIAGMVTLGSSTLGDVSAVAFAISLFTLICATEALK